MMSISNCDSGNEAIPVAADQGGGAAGAFTPLAKPYGGKAKNYVLPSHHLPYCIFFSKK